jgi:hypothetical protein
MLISLINELVRIDGFLTQLLNRIESYITYNRIPNLDKTQTQMVTSPTLFGMHIYIFSFLLSNFSFSD